MGALNFRSRLAPYIIGLIEQKRALGYKYTAQVKILQKFDMLCAERFSEDSTVTKAMTEIELNEKITNLLSENPTQQKQSRRPYARENRVKKDDRLLRIIQRYYIPHAGYVDCGFDSTTLLHSGKYIKYPKHSHCQRWMKRLTSKKTRRCTDLVRKGNEYRRLFDYWWTLY